MDITTCDKIAAYVSSDEDEEDRGCLLYLPIAPEVEEPEDSQLNLVSVIYMVFSHFYPNHQIHHPLHNSKQYLAVTFFTPNPEYS